MTSPIEAHKFNNDLLLAESDRVLARRLFPTVYDVLDHPELRDLFLTYDVPANPGKAAGPQGGIYRNCVGVRGACHRVVRIPAGEAQRCTFS